MECFFFFSHVNVSIFMKWKIPNFLYSKVMNRLVPSESFSSNVKNNREKKKRKRNSYSFCLLVKSAPGLLFLIKRYKYLCLKDLYLLKLKSYDKKKYLFFSSIQYLHIKNIYSAYSSCHCL